MFTDNRVPEKQVIYNTSLEHLYKTGRDKVKIVFHRVDTQLSKISINLVKMASVVASVTLYNFYFIYLRMIKHHENCNLN